MVVNVLIEGYYREVFLGADDLAPIIADYYGIEEKKAFWIIDEFDLEEKIAERFYDEVETIAEEKWRCCYE